MIDFHFTSNEEESLCYSCRLYDRIKGCMGLSDTYFPDYKCPFYKPIIEEKKEIDTRSDCSICFAGTGMSGGCRALVEKPKAGKCLFFKSAEDYERECRKCDKRIREYVKAHPGILDKYYTLKEPKTTQKAVKADV